MLTAGKNCRSVLETNDDYNTIQMVTSWQYTCESIKESIRTLREMIDVRRLGIDTMSVLDLLVMRLTSLY